MLFLQQVVGFLCRDVSKGATIQSLSHLQRLKLKFPHGYIPAKSPCCLSYSGFYITILGLNLIQGGRWPRHIKTKMNDTKNSVK